jgi:quercetin dioxygenase-like cupin family protein
MTYPEAKYHGSQGERSARLVRADDAEPDIRYRTGGTVHYLATAAATGGDFGLYRWNFAGGVSGPEPHFHRTITESFYILDGTVRLYDGETWTDAEAGDFLRVPPGGVHAFRNESGRPASMLLLFTPGAPREEYFEWLDQMGRGLRTLTEQEREAFMLRHDTFWV